MQPAIIHITFQGNVPSKKNNKRIIVRGGRPLIISSARHNAWAEDMLWMLKSVTPKKPVTNCAVKMTFWSGDLRAGDLDNRATSILDLLVKGKIIADDAWSVVKKLELEYAGLDRENPRAEVSISYVQP